MTRQRRSAKLSRHPLLAVRSASDGRFNLAGVGAIRPLGLLAIALELAIPGQALANDANAALAAGGLVPAQSTTIRLVSERLELSPNRVRVRYLFRNLSSKPQDVLVLFPFARTPVGGDVEQGIPWDNPAAIFDLKVRVRGQPVIPRYAMPRGADGRYQAFWRQSYAPHEDVIVVHDYRPILGNAMTPPTTQRLRSDWCLSRPPRGLRQHYVAGNLRYILLSALTWAGPIDDFRLIVHQRRSRAGTITALCGFPLRATGDGTLEYHARDFVPTRDIDLLWLNHVIE